MRKALAVSLGLSLSCTPLVDAAPRAMAAAAALLQDSESEDVSSEQLDDLLAPIALYPDPLLAQVLLAATFVDQVDEAARYVRAYGQDGVDDEPWDVSVKAVAHYPLVLSYLADRIDWTTALGQAYAAQSTDVMISIQRLRQMARSQGNLQTTSEQEVLVEDDDIQIVPAQPGLIYVPRYSPAIVYHHRPLSGLAISFGVGLAIGAWLNDDCDWRGHRVYYHGWSGGGWIGRSRPHVQITPVYVNGRFSSVVANRKALDRNVTYGNVRFHGNLRIDTQAVDGRMHPGNAIINRNMNTRDPRLDRYRGRDDQLRPGPNARVVPTPPSAPGPPPAARFERPPRPGPHAYGKAEGGFNPNVASRRGQSSREAARATAPSSERKKNRR
jgi:hypothetical protein